MRMTHADMINLWPSLGEFAIDIGAAYENAKAMRRRSSVPAQYWKRMVDAAAQRELADINYGRLAEAAATHREAAE